MVQITMQTCTISVTTNIHQHPKNATTATGRTIQREATKVGASAMARGGIGSPSLRTTILQPRFKWVAHCININAD